MKTKKPVVTKLTIGLDLGDRQHHACVLDAAGEIVAREVIVNTREVLTAFCARYPGATIVMGIEPAISDEASPSHRASSSEEAAGAQPPRG